MLYRIAPWDTFGGHNEPARKAETHSEIRETSSQFRPKLQNGRWLASDRSPPSAGTGILLLNNSQAISTAQMIWIYS